MKHALQAATGLTTFYIVLGVLIFLFVQSDSPDGFFVAPLSGSIVFFVTLSLWWVVFKTDKIGVLHTIYLGPIIGAISEAILGFSYLIWNNPNLFLYFVSLIPSHFVFSLPRATVFVLPAVIIRWLQLRRPRT